MTTLAGSPFLVVQNTLKVGAIVTYTYTQMEQVPAEAPGVSKRKNKLPRRLAQWS
jgi:hypothetical protein